MKNLDLNSAKNYILYCLSNRMYTKKELSDKLKNKNYPEEIILEAIGSMEDKGIINDYDYAFAYLHDNITLKSKGLFRVKQELFQKGIKGDIVDRVVSENNFDTASPLLEYARIRFGENKSLSPKEFEKVKAHLIRRGYSASEIKKCLEELEIRANWSDEF